MPKATNSEAVAHWNRSSNGAGIVDVCEKTLAELEAEADSTFDSFVSTADAGRKFESVIDRIEGQLATAKKLESAERDLELNEAVVIIENVESEIAVAEQLATGAALAETEEEWAAQLEGVHSSIDLLRSHMKKIKGSGKSAMHDGGALEARNVLVSFRREAGRCRESLEMLKEKLKSKKHHTHAQVEAAKRGLKAVRAGVGKAFSKITRSRLRKKIDEARAEITNFFASTHSAKLFVDHKHLTLQSGAHKVHIPLTQALRFALEDIAPIEHSLANLGRRGTVLTGSYERGEAGGTLRIGERSVTGDAIIYREKSYSVNF
ncbi:MAG: hypothetical protein NTV88_04225 [Candidatus Micrarchaeota archaeon]|nr:hypothetical protein [Candidatus Micrarchaeota archaeon]